MKANIEIKKEEGNPYLMIVPLYNSDAEGLAKLKQKVKYKINITASRNSKFHNLVFAAFRLGYDNQESYNNEDDYREEILIRAGHYRLAYIDGQERKKAKSISHTAVDQIEIEEIFNRVLDVLAIQLDSAPTFIKEELNRFM